MIDKIREIINSNSSKKIIWFDIIESSGNNTPIIFKNNRLHSLNERENNGYGIRINVDGKTGFSYTNDISRIEDTIQRAIDLSPYSDSDNFNLPFKTGIPFEPFDSKINDFDVATEIEKGKIVISDILSAFPQTNIDVRINCSRGNTRIINSNGIDVSYNNSYYSASISVTNIDKDQTKTDVWESLSSLFPIDFFYLTDIIKERLKKSSNLSKTFSGKKTIILTPKAFSGIMRIAAAGLNGKSVWKGLSPFSDKLNKKLFNKKLSIYDNPLIGSSPYSYPFDDEGMAALEKTLIDEGVIRNFITDLKFANKLGLEPSGNGARGFASLPHPSFSNIIVKNGDEMSHDIIRNVSDGILVDQFIGLGQSNTLTGDFSANLDLAFLIEKGEITGRVKDCMVSDNLFELLKGEILLSKDLKIYGSSQLPYILFPQVNFTA